MVFKSLQIGLHALFFVLTLHNAFFWVEQIITVEVFVTAVLKWSVNCVLETFVSNIFIK